MRCALKIKRSGKTFCIWLFRPGPGAGFCLRPSSSLGTCGLAVDGGMRHRAYCSELWKLQETKRRSDLGLGVHGLHKGGMSLELPGVSSSLGSRGEVSRRDTWGSPWPPGTTPGLFIVASSGQEHEAPWSFGGPSPRGGLCGARAGRHDGGSCLDYLSGPACTWTLPVCEKGRGASVARALSCPPSCTSPLASRPTMRLATPGTGSTSCPSSSSAPSSCSTWCWACSRGKRPCGCVLPLCSQAGEGADGTGHGLCGGGGEARPGPGTVTPSVLSSSQPVLGATILTSPLVVPGPGLLTPSSWPSPRPLSQGRGCCCLLSGFVVQFLSSPGDKRALLCDTGEGMERPWVSTPALTPGLPRLSGHLSLLTSSRRQGRMQCWRPSWRKVLPTFMGSEV